MESFATYKKTSDYYAEPIDPNLFQLVVSTFETQQFFNVALLTVLVYHSVITMDKEVTYFWPNPRNSVSLIYFANRYFGVIGAICPIIITGIRESPVTCKFSTWAQGIATLITVVLIDYILLIRVMALYQRNHSLYICLKILLSLEATTCLGIFIYSIVFEEGSVGSLAEGASICVSVRETPDVLDIISWAIPMAYGLVLLALALYKAAEYWRLSSRFKGFHLVAVLVEDQVIYYGFVIFCCTLKIIEIRLFNINPFIADVLDVAGSPTLLCILGGQLLINLKDAGEMGVNGETNNRTESVSDIQFA